MKTNKKAYRDYLKSMHWYRLRIDSAKRYGEGCYACRRSYIVEYHHLTYRPDLTTCTTDDVIPLCPGCHNIAHRSRLIDSTASNSEKRAKLRSIVSNAIASVTPSRDRFFSKVVKERHRSRERSVAQFN